MRSVIWVVHLPDFYCVVCEVIVDYVGQILAFCEKSEHFSVVVQELLLTCYSATAQTLFQEFFHFCVFFFWNLDL